MDNRKRRLHEKTLGRGPAGWAIVSLTFDCLVIAAGCAGATSGAPPVSAEPAPAVPGAPAPPAPARLVEGAIVEEGPLGDGPCVQKSYRVRPAGGGESIWIHFERCHDAQGPSPGGRGLESLDVGKSFRFTVRDGASPNFADEPVVLDAAPIDVPPRAGLQ